MPACAVHRLRRSVVGTWERSGVAAAALSSVMAAAVCARARLFPWRETSRGIVLTVVGT